MAWGPSDTDWGIAIQVVGPRKIVLHGKVGGDRGIDLPDIVTDDDAVQIIKAAEVEVKREIESGEITTNDNDPLSQGKLIMDAIEAALTERSVAAPSA